MGDPSPQVQGGGNAANALTAAARLGLMSTLVTKVSILQSKITLYTKTIPLPSRLHTMQNTACSQRQTCRLGVTGLGMESLSEWH